MSDKAYKRLYSIVAIVSWFLLTIVTIYTSPKIVDVSTKETSFQAFFCDLFLLSFITNILLYFRTDVPSRKSEEFSNTLFRLFLYGLVMAFVMTLIGVVLSFGVGQAEKGDYSLYQKNHYLINILNNLSLAIVVVFISNMFYVFKEMIIYQITRIGFRTWKLFERAIFLSLPLAFIHFDFENTFFLYVLFIYFLFGLILSVNQNWIVYFSLVQKWKSVLMTFLILTITVLFAFFIYKQASDFGVLSSNDIQVIDIIADFPIVSLFVFIITYCICSILVILFNLPISAAFERKFNETLNFQQLNSMAQTGGREDEIYPILLERSVRIVMADAAWLDIYEAKDINRTVLTNHIDKSDIRFIKVLLERKVNLSKTNALNFKSIQDERVKAFIAQKPYKSILYIPLAYGYEIIGELVLIRGLFDGFDKQLIDSVKTYADQAVSSIINSRLINEAVENQRYQEEKKIAQDVKAQLIQDVFPSCKGFEIAALTKSSGDVGGDYFDFAELGENLYALAIADVSGSGITAAFNMAQLRGIFKTLVLLSKETPTDFINDANKALSSSLA